MSNDSHSIEDTFREQRESLANVIKQLESQELTDEEERQLQVARTVMFRNLVRLSHHVVSNEQ